MLKSAIQTSPWCEQKQKVGILLENFKNRIVCKYTGVMPVAPKGNKFDRSKGALWLWWVISSMGTNEEQAVSAQITRVLNDYQNIFGALNLPDDLPSAEKELEVRGYISSVL